jgi:hypothetical protein
MSSDSFGVQHEVDPRSNLGGEFNVVDFRNEFLSAAALSPASLANLSVKSLFGTYCFDEDGQPYQEVAEKFFDHMSKSQGVTADEAWQLTRRMAGEIFERLHRSRHRIERLGQHDPRYFVYGALLTHQTMSGFTAHANFEDHEALQGILVRFLIKQRTDLQGLEKLRMDQEKLKNDLVLTKQKLNTLDNKVKAGK